MPPDYSGQNLRGRSFKGQNLERSNFNGADIRGADFSDANLTGANFAGAKAGLQKRLAACLVAVSWWLSAIAGFLSAFLGLIISYIFSRVYINQVSGGAVLVIVIVVFIVIIRQGFNSPVTVAFAFAFSFAGTLAGVIAGTISFNISFGGAIAGAGTIAITIAIAIAGAGIFAIAGAGAFVLLSIYVSWRSLKGDEKYALIRNIAVAFAASGGTTFRNANLSDANFTGAALKNTDFRKAILIRTCFRKTKKLDLARPGVTYLQKAEVPGVLVTGQGQDKIFDRQDLRGVNFKGANLVDASFIGANLSEANLQDADLSRAKLVQAQLDGTDFTGATLTGAYIKDWGITSDTNFDGVRCEYVYMRLPTKENPDPLRKPDNREEVFADGEFGDFIKPIVDTLDLYHNQGVHPRAIAISFKQLAENHPDAELEIVAMEKRGLDKFLLRAKTAPTTDKSELSAEYFDTYNHIKSLPERDIKLLLAEKDSRITSLENFVNTALQRPSFYSNTQIEKLDSMNPNQGGINQGVSNSQIDGGLQAVQGNNNQQNMKNKTSKFDLRNAQFGGGLVDADTVHAHQIGGNINHYTPQQRQNLVEAAREIQQLLQQLEQTNPTTTTFEKTVVVAKAIDEIEKNPTLKARVIGALKSGGKEALKEAVDHPLVNILMASIEGWQEAE